MKPIIIGHRGACGYAPENTLKSFEKAIALGAEMIEFDVHLCKSGEVVVIHDDTVDRTTNGTGAVQDKTLAELKQLDAGDGERIPTLAELFDHVHHRAQLYVELKGPDTAMPVLSIIEEYIKEREWKYEDFLVASFDHYQLKKIKEKNPYVRIAPITYNMLVGYEEYVKKLQADVIVLCIDTVWGQFFESMEETDLPIYVFTVNTTYEMQRINDKKIEGIITDYPDRIYKFLNKKPGI